MLDILKFMKENKYRIIKWLFICFVICLLIVQVPFWIGNFKVIISTDFNPGDILGFLGSYLAAAGTILLGCVAIFQTDKAYRQSKDANQIAKDALEQAKISNQLAAEMHKLEVVKFISMISLSKIRIGYYRKDSRDNSDSEMKNPQIIEMIDEEFFKSLYYYHINICFKNESNYPITEINADACDLDKNRSLRYGIKEIKESTYIPPGGDKIFRFIIPADTFKKYNKNGVFMTFSFVNIFEYSTFSNLTIENLSQNGTVTDYAYRIEKIMENDDYSFIKY